MYSTESTKIRRKAFFKLISSQNSKVDAEVVGTAFLFTAARFERRIIEANTQSKLHVVLYSNLKEDVVVKSIEIMSN
jgi:hypothetical protein